MRKSLQYSAAAIFFSYMKLILFHANQQQICFLFQEENLREPQAIREKQDA